ncbi:hypothetical protein QBC44DRAFT_47913 [Cladorrhinum sp. PSN332]|nr:hypothetical protein QBC44DRAFT_47913 [Cladorrhinum sp. PSN332]
MSSFGNSRLSSGGRQLRVPERLRSSHPKNFDSSSSGGMMEDIIYNHSSKDSFLDHQPSSTLLINGPTDNGSLLDYFDLPSPPSTPMNPTHHFSSINEAFPPASPGLSTSSVSSCSTFSSPPSSPGMGGHHWPTASQRISRLPVRPRSNGHHSRSSSTSSSGSGADTLIDGIGNLSVNGPAITVRAARRTPYYPPNSSRTREGERARVFMNRGPHYVPNWTPMSSLPRHVQLQIEERMVRFTAI